MKILLYLLFFTFLIGETKAQNSMVGDGFGGRLWYKPSNYGVGSYSAYNICGDSGILFAWGNNSLGQFGNNTKLSSSTPVKVNGMKDVKYVSAGYNVGAIKKDNTAWAWGSSSANVTQLSWMPSKYADSAVFIHAGVFAVEIIKMDGTVWCTGFDYWGMFGYESFVYPIFNKYKTPVKMKGISNAVRIAGATSTMAILLKDGTVMTTGSNSLGQLGCDSANFKLYSIAPVRVKNLKRIIDVKANAWTFIALDSVGDVYTWGGGGVGCIGNGNTKDAIVPEKVKTLKNIVAISACNDGYHFLALDENKNCYGWGQNKYSTAGGFLDNTGANILKPKLLATDVIDIMAGEAFSYIVKTDGSLWAIGYGNSLIWMDLKDSIRTEFTKMDPTVPPMNSCKPINPNIKIGNWFGFSGTQCEINSISFEAKDSIQFVDISWDFGDGTPNIKGTKVKHRYKKSGDYSVIMYSAPKSFGKIDTVVQKITIYPLPEVNFSVNDSIQCLDGNIFTFKDTNLISGQIIQKRIWDFGDGITSTQANPSHIFKGVGKYNVQLLVSSDNLCSDTVSHCIIVNPGHKINIPITICEGQFYNMNSQNYYKSGTYYDTLTTISGCDSIIQLQLSVNPRPAIPSIPDTIICEGDQVSFDFSTYNLKQLHLNSQPINSKFSLEKKSAYTIEFSDSNNCISLDTFTIDYENCDTNELKISNVFTPGSDGFNDNFDIVIEGETYYMLNIYNRWGQLIFKQDNDAETQSIANWNGRINNKGANCPEGTYFYIFEYRFKNKELRRINGTIAVIR